jgi:tetrahydromethanopterin S-methyltransferase subunit H
LLRSAGATRILPAVAETEAFLATAAFAETKQLPKDSNHPLFKLFPEFVEQLKSLAG